MKKLRGVISDRIHDEVPVEAIFPVRSTWEGADVERRNTREQDTDGRPLGRAARHAG